MDADSTLNLRLPVGPEPPMPTNQGAEQQPMCPNCGHPHRLGELICPVCGLLLARGGTTQQINLSEIPERKKPRHGQAFVEHSKSICFEVAGQHLSVPLKSAVVLGRGSDISDDAQPDLDLGPYNAHKYGVSRRHARIRYEGFMTYISDLGSSNGTWLNGQRLVVNKERLLRNGDELQLGQLRIRVKF
jgi:FHA domain